MLKRTSFCRGLTYEVVNGLDLSPSTLKTHQIRGAERIAAMTAATIDIFALATWSAKQTKYFQIFRLLRQTSLNQMEHLPTG